MPIIACIAPTTPHAPAVLFVVFAVGSFRFIIHRRPFVCGPFASLNSINSSPFGSVLCLATLVRSAVHYTAHTTAADILWAGTPLLTLPSERMSSRVSASLLSALGASELIARTLDEYYKIARASRYLRLTALALFHSQTKAPTRLHCQGPAAATEATLQCLRSRTCVR
jgi:hypothetical protein